MIKPTLAAAGSFPACLAAIREVQRRVLSALRHAHVACSLLLRAWATRLVAQALLGMIRSQQHFDRTAPHINTSSVH